MGPGWAHLIQTMTELVLGPVQYSGLGPNQNFTNPFSYFSSERSHIIGTLQVFLGPTFLLHLGPFELVQVILLGKYGPGPRTFSDLAGLFIGPFLACLKPNLSQIFGCLWVFCGRVLDSRGCFSFDFVVRFGSSYQF